MYHKCSNKSQGVYFFAGQKNCQKSKSRIPTDDSRINVLSLTS